MTSRKNVTQKLVLAALMAALTAICSQILIPLPLFYNIQTLPYI